MLRQWGYGPARRYGFWRGLLDGVVARYLDCGIFERGFVRIRCPDCAAGYLLALACPSHYASSERVDRVASSELLPGSS